MGHPCRQVHPVRRWFEHTNPLPRRANAPAAPAQLAVERTTHHDTVGVRLAHPARKGLTRTMLNSSSVRRPGGPIAIAARSSDSRRLRRRSMADDRLYCGTNGCTTYLALDARSGVASCPICGFRRTIE